MLLLGLLRRVRKAGQDEDEPCFGAASQGAVDEIELKGVARCLDLSQFPPGDVR